MRTRIWQATTGALAASLLAAPLAGQSVVGSITRPNFFPTAVAVYEAGNKVFFADATTLRIYRYDGVTHAELDSVSVPSAAYLMVIHEPSGKLYALSSQGGVITVINAASGALIRSLSGYAGIWSDLQLDPGVGKLYAIATSTGVRQINISDDAVTPVPGVDIGAAFTLAVNPVTHEVFACNGNYRRLYVINGSTLAVTGPISFPCGFGHNGLAVNWLENKVYSAWPGNHIYDRNTGQVTPIGIGMEQNDAEHLLFNPTGNKMYTDTEIEYNTTIIHGQTNAAWNLALGTTAAAPPGLRLSTNHLYFPGMDRTIVLEDGTQMMKLFPVNNPSGGGGLAQGVAVNQTTGRVYVINDARLGSATVFQDAPFSCPSSIVPSSAAASSDYQLLGVSVTTTTDCTWAVAEPLPHSLDTGSWVYASTAGAPIFTGSGSINIAVKANQSPAPRTGSLLVAGKPFTVTQAGQGGGAAVPTVVGVSPASGSGTSQTFTFTFSDANGWQDLGVVNVLINFWLDGRQACYLAYSRPLGVLYLMNDAGTALSPALVLGSGGSVGNSQCTVYGTGSSAVGGGNTLTLTLNMSFSGQYAGSKIIYLAARDVAENNSGWQRLGVWNVPGAVPTSPAVVSMTPARGTGAGPAGFTFQFSDTDGWQDLGVVNILVNDWLDGRNACYLAYSRPLGALYLVNDAGTGLLGPIALGSGSSVSNSQCTVYGSGSSASGSGNTLTLTLRMSFMPSFWGNRVFYLAARDVAEHNSGWQVMGSWTVP